MQNREITDIKRHADGSLDIAHYIETGRQRRSEQAHKMAKNVLSKRKALSLRVWFLTAVRA